MCELSRDYCLPDLNEISCRFQTSLHFKCDHSSKHLHLLLGNLMSRVGLQSYGNGKHISGLLTGFTKYAIQDLSVELWTSCEGNLAAVIDTLMK